MAYIPPVGMGTLNAMTAQDWISAHLQPTEPQMQHLFEHVYPQLDQVLNVCRLTTEICHPTTGRD